MGEVENFEMEPEVRGTPGWVCNFVALVAHLFCLLFNAMFRHSFVPSDFSFGTIIALLYDKHGGSSKIDMY